MKIASLAFIASICASSISAEELVIGAWNIADLHHGEGVEAKVRKSVGTTS